MAAVLTFSISLHENNNICSIMIIGYDAKRIVRNATGLGNYGRTLINSLSAVSDHRFLLYAPDSGRDDLRTKVDMRPHVEFRYPAHARFRFQRDLWRSRGIVADLVSDGVQLYHGLSGELPVGIRCAGIPAVVTVHDLIFMRHPEYYRRIDAAIYRRKFYSMLKEADRIIAISECTRRDILHYSDYPADRISVVYQSASAKFGSAAGGALPAELSDVSRYVLQVGTIEERKNALESVMALEYLPADVHLVLVGRETAYSEQVRRYAAQHALTGRLHVMSGVGDDELAALYHNAQCFVYPSRYEGFGIPIIEAIQCGLPVVAATGSCLEEAGGPDSLYVSPDAPEDMAAAVMQMLGSARREQAIERSRQYVRRFENSDVARQVLQIYDMVIAENRK